MRKALLLVTAAMLCMACEKPADKEQRHLRNGNEYFAKGMYAEARLEYKNAAQIMPTDAEPRYRLGLVDEAQDDPKNAIGNFMAAEQQNKHHHAAMLKVAHYFLLVGAFDEADHRIADVIREASDNAEAYALRGAILLRKKEFGGAEKEAARALEKDPKNITAVSVLTGIYAGQKQFPKAIEALDKGIEQNPTEVSLQLLKVLVYEKMEDFASMIPIFEKVIALNPKKESYRVNMSEAYIQMKDLAKAEEVLRKAVADLPESWSMKHKLVEFLSKQRGVNEAEAEIKSLMTSTPAKDDLYFWLADLYVEHKTTDRAVSLLEQVVTQNPSDQATLSARSALAHIQFTKGNREMADKLVDMVLKKDPGNLTSLMIRAQMDYDRGNLQQAVADLRTVLRDHPKTEDAYKLLAETLVAQGHIDLAIDTLSQLVTAKPESITGAVRLAQMHAMAGNVDKGIEQLTSIAKVMPDFAVAWESIARLSMEIKDWKGAEAALAKLEVLPKQENLAHLIRAQLLDKSGKSDEAQAMYLKVIATAPDSPLADHALKGLAALGKKRGQVPQLMETLNKLNLKSALAHALLAECHLALKQLPEAAAELDAAIAAKPDFVDPYLLRANLFIAQNKGDDALATLKAAREAFPADVRVSMSMAYLFVKSGHHKEAIDIYAAILEARPETDDAASNMAQLIAQFEYKDSKQLEKALQIAERFSRSGNPLYLDTLAWVYFRQGKLDQAQTLMERIMAGKGEIPAEIHYHYASLLQAQGREKEAALEWERATPVGASYPGSDEAFIAAGKKK